MDKIGVIIKTEQGDKLSLIVTHFLQNNLYRTSIVNDKMDEEHFLIHKVSEYEIHTKQIEDYLKSKGDVVEVFEIKDDEVVVNFFRRLKNLPPL